MNPLNILQEFERMYASHADDGDRQVVAEEILEILHNHPVMERFPSHYESLKDVQSLLSGALRVPNGVSEEGAAKRGMEQLKSREELLKAFIRQSSAAVEKNFVKDSLFWLSESLILESESQFINSQDMVLEERVERVCCDLLSAVHADGFSLESLHLLYKIMSTEVARNSNAAMTLPYNFSHRFAKIEEILLALPRRYKIVFTIDGMPHPINQVSGIYGEVTISMQEPEEFLLASEKLKSESRWKKSWAANNQRLFAEVEIYGKDGRSAGMLAYSKVGRLLDLIRFEFNAENLRLSTDFALIELEKLILLPLPQIVPNPKPQRSASDLGAFVAHLDSISSRDHQQSDAKDRILSAFRFYRIGTAASTFENKLVNWWTALEYLMKGSKKGGAIGDSVKNSLVPSLGLMHLSKHLLAFKEALSSLDGYFGEGSEAISFSSLTVDMVYSILTDPVRSIQLVQACSEQPYLSHHLNKLAARLQSEANIAEALKDHDRKLRWQVQRVYRARCDIVHSARSVVTAGLLCANLEYYLRSVLGAILVAYRNIPTLRGPTEFFERDKYLYECLISELQPRDKKKIASRIILRRTLS
jgi:hypothetical protein